MESLMNTLTLAALTAVIPIAALPKLRARIQLSLAKHRSLAGHAKMSRQIAKWVPYYEYDDTHFFQRG